MKASEAREMAMTKVQVWSTEEALQAIMLRAKQGELYVVLDGHPTAEAADHLRELGYDVRLFDYRRTQVSWE